MNLTENTSNLDLFDSSDTTALKRRPGRPRLSEQAPDALETRDKIIYDAKKLFMQRGYSAISISHIVEAVGVTKPTLYYYFPDKEHLYTAVLTSMIETGSPHFSCVLDDPNLSLAKKLETITKGYLEFSGTSVNMLLRDAAEYLNPQNARIVQDCYYTHVLKPFTDMFENGIKNGEACEKLCPQTLSLLFLSQLDAFYVLKKLNTWRHPEAPAPEAVLNDAQLARNFSTVFFSGLSPLKK